MEELGCQQQPGHMEELPSGVGNDAPRALIKHRETWAELVARTWCGVWGVHLHLKTLIKILQKLGGVAVPMGVSPSSAETGGCPEGGPAEVPEVAGGVPGGREADEDVQDLPDHAGDIQPAEEFLPGTHLLPHPHPRLLCSQGAGTPGGMVLLPLSQGSPDAVQECHLDAQGWWAACQGRGDPQEMLHAEALCLQVGTDEFGSKETGISTWRL